MKRGCEAKENPLHAERIMKRGNVYICASWGAVINKMPYMFDCLNKIETSSHDEII